MSELDKCREAFEAWITKTYGSDWFPLDRDGNGVYIYYKTFSEWQAYQAAWNTRCTDPLVDEMAELIQYLIDNSPNDCAGGSITVLDVWRKDARYVLFKHQARKEA